jgi:hypothetical protein
MRWYHTKPDTMATNKLGEVVVVVVVVVVAVVVVPVAGRWWSSWWSRWFWCIVTYVYTNTKSYLDNYRTIRIYIYICSYMYRQVNNQQLTEFTCNEPGISYNCAAPHP